MLNGQRVIFVGRLGKNPELKKAGNAGPVCNLSVAVKGELEGEVNWKQVSVWGNQARYCNEMLNKGSQIFIQGVNKISTYVNKDGIETKVNEISARLVGIVPLS